MSSVRFSGWMPGLRKVSHSMVLRNWTGMSLTEAKAVTDRVFEGQVVVVEVASHALADSLAAELRALGAVSEAGSD
jgi:ribosomal protein L7/L12